VLLNESLIEWSSLWTVLPTVLLSPTTLPLPLATSPLMSCPAATEWSVAVTEWSSKRWLREPSFQMWLRNPGAHGCQPPTGASSSSDNSPSNGGSKRATLTVPVA